jgi:hypothetical protein
MIERTDEEGVMPLSASRCATTPAAHPAGGHPHRWDSVRDLARPSRYRSSEHSSEERTGEASAGAGRADRTVVVLAVDLPAGDGSDVRPDLRRAVDAAVSDCGLRTVSEDHRGGLVLLVRARPARVLRDITPALVERFRSAGSPLPSVRVAVHDGSVEYAIRISDLPDVRRVLAASLRSRVVVAVSDDVYEAVVAPGHAGGSPSTYAPVLVEDGRRVWLNVPGYQRPPVDDDPPRSRGERAQRPADGVSIGNLFTGSVVNGPVYGGDHMDLRGGDRG